MLARRGSKAAESGECDAVWALLLGLVGRANSASEKSHISELSQYSSVSFDRNFSIAVR